MVMTEDRPADAGTTHELLPPTYGVLDFNAPATIGIVLYESQLTRGQLRNEFTEMGQAIRADMAAMEKSLRADMAEMGQAIRADMAAMEKSLREEIAKSSRNIITIIVTLHSIAVSAVVAAVALF